MYKMLLALALAFAIRENVTRLLQLEGGIQAFETVHWVLAALTLVMAPICVLTFISGWKESKREREEKVREEAEREAELTSEKYGDVLGPAEDAQEQEEEAADAGASKYDY